MPLLFSLLIAGAACAQDGNITVYRCVDGKGRLTLQDAPCPKGDTQQTRTMVQPKDAPRPTTQSAAVATPVSPVQSASQDPRVVILRAPQATYECVRPDNSVYTSENGDGNPRYVSAFDTDSILPRRGDSGRGGSTDGTGTFTPVSPPLLGIARGTQTVSSPDTSGLPSDLPSRPRPPGRPGRPGYGYGYGYGYGASSILVRDECHALPQSEVCDRLGDRRDEIRRRFFNAQETERAALSREERGINARLASDCGVN